MLQNRIPPLIAKYVDLHHLECDGLSRMIDSVLTRENIPHQNYWGELRYNNRSITHFWIDVCEENTIYRIDYRAQMWFGNSPEIPHGIFRPSRYSRVDYKGSRIEFPPLSVEVLELIATPVEAFF